MANLTNQQIIEDGIIVVDTILDATNTFTNSGREFILYKNISGVNKIIKIDTVLTTIDIPTFGDLTKSNASKQVLNGESVTIGPFPTAAYNGTDGIVSFQITPYDAETRDSASVLFI